MNATRYLLVAAGGALGSVARYWVGGWAPRLLGQAFPYGTLIVNLVGSFLIGVVMTVALSTVLISPNLRLFLTVGIMGGFTTYSSFNYETLVLFQQRLWGAGALNLGLTVAGCLVAGGLGLALGRALVSS
ncbi:MAG TPA: fluoride efflux transporter CrcB [Myxococcaceae bacterium]|nr:fluoride efflux transporter CrcB [Myxococcaceae bacterium]